MAKKYKSYEEQQAALQEQAKQMQRYNPKKSISAQAIERLQNPYYERGTFKSKGSGVVSNTEFAEKDLGGFTYPTDRKTYYKNKAEDKRKSSKISELADWAKTIRTTDASGLQNAAKKSEEYKSYFSANRNDYDAMTMNQVRQLLSLTDAEIQRKSQDVLDKKQGITGGSDSGNGSVQKKSPFVTGAVSEAEMQRNLAEQYKVQQGEKAFEQKVKQDAYNEKDAEYQTLKNAKDFDAISQYKSTANGRKFDGSVNAGYGWDDMLYEYVNQNKDAQRIADDYGDFSFLPSVVGNDKTFLQQMDEDQIRTFNYIDKTQGREASTEYLEHLRPQLTALQRQEKTEKAQKHAEEHPVLASIESVLASPLKTLSYVGQIGDLTKDGEIDQNARYNQMSYLNTAVRDKVSENFGDVGTFAYQTGMSMADFAWNMILFGGAAQMGGATPEAMGQAMQAAGETGVNWAAASENLMLGVMSSGAAADKVIESKDKGLDDTDAFLLGTVAGFAEYASEKISLEALLDEIPRLGKNLAGYIAKNTLAEGSEEVASDLINLVADIAISKDKSEWMQAVQEYVDQGYSETEAFGLAMADQAKQMGLSFAGGAISGGLFAGGGSSVATLTNAWTDANQNTVNYSQDMAQGMTGTSAADMQRKRASEIYAVIEQANQDKEQAEQDAAENTLEAAAAWEEKNAELQPTENMDILPEEKQLPDEMEAQAAELERQFLDGEISEDEFRARQREITTTPETDVIPEEEELTEQEQETNPVINAAEEAVEAEKTSALDQRIAEFNDNVDKQDGYGTQGKKAVKELYSDIATRVEQDNLTPQQAQAVLTNVVDAYDRIYTAIRTQGTVDENDIRILSAVSPTAALEAANAGIKDAKQSIAERIKSAETTVSPEVSGGLVSFNSKDAGVVESTELLDAMNSGRISKEAVQRWNTAAKLLGTRINFVEGLAENAEYNYKTGEVTVSIDADLDKTMDFYLGHEFTHRLEHASPEQYAKLVESVRTTMQNNKDGDAWAGALKDYRTKIDNRLADLEQKFNDGKITEEEYNKQKEDLTLTDEDLVHEVVADYIGNMLVNDSTVMDDFIRKHVGTKDGRKLMQRLRDFFRDIARKLRGNGASKRYSDAEKVLSEALQMSHENVIKMLDQRQAERDVADNSRQKKNSVRNSYRITDADAYGAIYESLDHADKGDDNLIRLSDIPQNITDISGITGDLYVFRNHLYENMVSDERAKAEGRYNEDGHYHKLGEDKMVRVLMSLNEPDLIISDGIQGQNPEISLLLPVFDENDDPIHAVIKFYANEPINGVMQKRPHVAVTFYGHPMEDTDRYIGLDKKLNNTKKSDILYISKEIRANQPVIAQHPALGNITALTLKKNVTQFKQLVNDYKDKNKIRYSFRQDSEGRQLTPAQQEYFSNTKVLDEDGNLRVVYHGSPVTDITVFDRSRRGQHTGVTSDNAIWFTDRQDFADDFSYEFKPTNSMFTVKRGEKGKVYPAYLNMTKPFDLTNPTQEMLDMLYEWDSKQDIDKLLDIGNHQLIKIFLDYNALEDAGYDGIIAKLSVQDDGLEYGIFNSNQVKDVNNENPTDSPDIRHSYRTDMEALPKGGDIPASLKKWAKEIGLDTLTKQDIKGPVIVSVKDLRTAWYEKNGRTKDAEVVNKALDAVGKMLTKLAGKYNYIDLGDALDATVHYRTNSEGKPTSVILSCKVKNAEYEVNFDFTTICSKRLAMQKVIEKFIKTEGERGGTLYDELKLDEEGMYKLRLILEAAGFEVSCRGCFVEQNRYSQQNQARTVANDWNAALDAWAKDNGVEITENFNLTDIDLDSLDYDEIDRGFKRYHELMKGQKANVETKNRILIESSPFFRKRMNPSDYASLAGQRALMAIGETKKGGTSLYGLLKRGQSDSKQSVPFTAYNGEVSLLPDKMKGMDLRDYLLSIGGARGQSASDFQIEFLYDYMQLIADLSARDLPMHMYTKVIEEAELLGMTGIKLNLSAMCDVDPSLTGEYAGLKLVNGKYEYNISDQSIDYPKAVKLQKKDGYSKNIGIIMVALSKQHMLKSLDDPDVRYIIGYHSSAMPVVVANMSKMGDATDYTKLNKTSKLTDKGRELFEQAKKEAKGNTELERYKDALRIFDDLIQQETSARKNRPRRGNEYGQYVSPYKANTADFNTYNDLRNTNDARTTADNYIAWCMENDYVPMYFPFAFHENYYKCEVYDFNMYDNVTGEYAPMEGVRNIYPGLNMDAGETDVTAFMKRVSKMMAQRNKFNQVQSAMYDPVFERAKNELRLSITGDDYMDFESSGIDHSELTHRADATENEKHPDIRHSTREIIGKSGKNYGLGVYLDTDIFDGVKPRDWGKKLGEFVYNNLAGKELVMFDEEGNEEKVYVARANDRVKKDGANNSHKVLDKLARYTGNNVKALVTVHLDEALKVSGNEQRNSEHTHQWLDEKGWIHRDVYVQTRNGAVYKALLNIGNGRDRSTIYEINKIDRIEDGAVPSINDESGSLINNNSAKDRITQEKGKNNSKKSFRGTTNIVEHAETVAENARLEQRIEQLQKQVDELKGEFKSNKGYKANVVEARKEFKNLLDVYGVDAAMAGIDVAKATNEFADMANRIARTPKDSYGDVRAWSTKLAYDMIWNAKEVVEIDSNVSDVKSLLQKKKIYVDPNTRNNVSADFDTDVRKAYMGRMTITYDRTKGEAIDSLYDELSNMYGYLFPDYITDPAEQLEQMMNVVDNKAFMEFNAYDEYSADTVDLVTNDIIDRLLAVAGVKDPDTFADKKDKQIAKAREKGRADVKKTQAEMRQRIKKLRDEKNARYEELKEHHREVKQRERSRKIESETREKLLKVAKRLEKMKTTGFNRALIQQALADFDTASRSISGKTLKEFAELRDWVNEQKTNDGDFLIDERTRAKLDRLEKIERQITKAGLTLEEVIERDQGWDQFSVDNLDAYDNSIEYMQDLCDVLRALETQIRNERQTIDTEDRRDIFMQGLISIDAIDNSYGVSSKASRFVDRWIFTEAARPSTEMLRLVGYNEDAPLYQRFLDLTKGQRDMVDYSRRANVQYFDRFTKDKDFIKSITGKDAREIEITGLDKKAVPIKLKVTPDLLMSMYMHSQNDQNVRHIMEGGMTVPDIKLYKQGKIAEAYEHGVKITMTKTALQSFALNNMTQKERAFCEAAKSYYKNMSQPELNEVSEKLVGYEIAKVDNYYRIVTDPNWMRTNLDGMKYDGTIEGMGFTKERIKMAQNPIQLIGMVSQVTTDIKMHSKYVGMAIPVRNFNKVLGVTAKTFNEKGDLVASYGSSVQDSIREKWGNAANNYIGKMLRDLQNPPRSTDYTYKQFFSKVRSHYAGAVLTLNASVAIKQAASYPTAAAVLGWEPLVKALGTFPRTKGKSSEFIAQYSPLMRLRTEGYISQETGDILSSGKKLPKLANWIQMVDVGTVRLLWLASEYSVQKSNPELKYGTKEFYEKVGELHTKVIEDTQPNYTELQRAQVLRSDSELVRMLNMFKTQPFQNFNILLEGFGKYRAKSIAYKNNPTDENLELKKQAGVQLRRAVTSQFVAAAVFAAMQWLWDLFRGKTDKYRDKDDEETLPGWLRGVGLNMLTSFAGMLPTFGNIALEFGESATDAIAAELGAEDPVFDQKYYGLDASSSLENINTLLTGAKDTITGFIGLGREIFATAESGQEPDWEKYLRDLFENGVDMAQFFGVPTNNIKNSIVAAVGQGAKLKDGEYIGQYAALRCGTGITDNNKRKYYDLLIKAYEHNDDSNPRYGGQFDKLYDMMINEEGFATSKHSAKENIDAKMKEYQKSVPRQEERKEQGIDSMAYQAALEMYDEDQNGKYTQEEVYNALNSMSLSASQKAYLWDENGWKKTYAEYAASQNKKKSKKANK